MARRNQALNTQTIAGSILYCFFLGFIYSNEKCYRFHFYKRTFVLFLCVCHREGSSLEEVVEKQADLIEYLKQHNTLLSKRLLNLTAQHWPHLLLPLRRKSPIVLTPGSPKNRKREGICGLKEGTKERRNTGIKTKSKEIPVHTSTCTHRQEANLSWDGQITQEEVSWKWRTVKEARWEEEEERSHGSQIRGEGVFITGVTTPSDPRMLPLVLLWETEEAKLF